MGPKLREKHCRFAIVNRYGRCTARCKYNLDTMYESDCIGKDRQDDEKRIKDEIRDRQSGLN